MNRLAEASSPYLLQHKDNPVDWWQWGPEAFAEARRSDRPVLLSVGYAACHWCHVMAHESFEDPSVAALMNALFVNIKVDREERPDVDQVYMSALHALGQQGGWPLTMFLTSAGDPVWGGTYFPPRQQFGRPSFTDVLRAMSGTFRSEPAKIERNREALAGHLRAVTTPEAAGSFGREELDDSALRILRIMDPAGGGIGGAPKFPNVPVLELLWRAHRRTGDPALRRSVHTALRQMARGGIHDQVGGGFARYSTDARWLAPHFEKMLYDNAQLLELYALAAAETGDRLFAETAAGIVDWLAREMITEGGAFAASLDADSEGVEGRFYVWTGEALEQALGPDEAALFARVYDIRPGGNWEGTSIPNRLAWEGVPSPDEERRLARARAILLAERARRVRPGRDDKVLADWNGLMIAALVRAGALLARPDWVELAAGAFDVVAERMSRGGALGHSYRAGRLVFPGFAGDLGAMARAALALAEVRPDRRYTDLARSWLAAADRDYLADDGAGYATASAAMADLPIRPRPTADDAQPNANSLLIEAHLALAALAADNALREHADRLLERLSAAMAGNVIGHASLLNVLDRRLRGAEIVVLGSGEEAESLARTALALPYPERTVLQSRSIDDLPPGHPVRSAAAAPGAAAFVCAGGRCSLPAFDPDGLAEAFHAAVA